jgi:hypothetical protein
MSEDGSQIVPGAPGGVSPPAPGGGGAPVPGDRAAALAAYLEANRGRYTEEALRRAATTAGYTDAEVDAAWAALASGPPATPDQGLRARSSMAVAIPVAIVYVVAVYLLVIGIGSTSSMGNLALPAFLALGIAGLLGTALLRDRYPSVALGLGCGVVLAVVLPVVLLLVLLGICVVSGGTPFVLFGGG